MLVYAYFTFLISSSNQNPGKSPLFSLPLGPVTTRLQHEHVILSDLLLRHVLVTCAVMDFYIKLPYFEKRRKKKQK